MSRKHRIWFPGAMYHITARGNKRAAIFQDHEDYVMYLGILQDVSHMYPFILHSYCLMTNHLHLQLETIQDHIQYIMKEIHSRYAVYLNRRLHTDGHVFQGRYGASIITDDRYFLEVSRYIHRNPLEAGMVKYLSNYPWSSYPSYISSSGNPYISKEKTYAYFSNPVHLNYQKFVETNIDIKEENAWQQLSRV